jgi:RNA polymerase sigma-70 factor (ECF subfamily)
LPFEETYRQLFASLHRYAFTIVNDNDWAIDIVQDAFLKYFHKLQQGAVIEQEKAYLFKVVYHTALTALRKEKKLKVKFRTMSGEETVDGIEVTIIEKEKHHVLQRMVDEIVHELPPQCKEAFLKSRMEGKKYREIALEMGLSVKTVEAHISKAIKLVQEYLRVNGHKLSLIQIVLLYEAF